MSAVERAVNPYTGEVVAQPSGASERALVQRESQEIQARMLVARNFPRDPIRATDKIINAFTRPTLCEDATYEYGRGGTEVSGLSIRAAEVLAQNWGNLACGVVELTRAAGQSECLSYATDLETGFHDEKRFFVRHWRDKKGGRGVPVTEERDIYEVIANYGARRKRACILAVIPSDVQEAAIRQIETTLRTNVDVKPEFIKQMVENFEKNFAVTKEMIEKRIQRHVDSILPAQVVTLRRIYASLKDGMSEVSAWFEVPAEAPDTGSDKPPADVPTSQTDQVKEQLKAKGGKKSPAAPAEENPPLPMFDEQAAIAELKKATSVATLEPLWTAVAKDFTDTRRPIPNTVEDAYQMLKEKFGEAEGKALDL